MGKLAECERFFKFIFISKATSTHRYYHEETRSDFLNPITEHESRLKPLGGDSEMKYTEAGYGRRYHHSNNAQFLECTDNF